MNFLKKGPELKVPELRVPDFLFDLYYDLKERHLLPLAAVLAVAIVVVPIAISQTSSSEPEELAPIATPGTASGEASSLVVAKSAPGLRDYRRRLRAARALDPFRKPAATAEASVEAPSETGSASEAASTPEAVETPPVSAEPPLESSPPIAVPSEPEGGGTPNVPARTRYESNTIDVRIVTAPPANGDAGSSAKPRAKVDRGLPELTMLPSRETPAAIFMGASSDGKKALLLVSSDVESIFGDGQCVIGSQSCQLLALEAGVPETFVYGPQERTYRIEILRIDQALTSKPHKASLGKPKGRKKGLPGEKGEAPESAGRVSAAQPR